MSARPQQATQPAFDAARAFLKLKQEGGELTAHNPSPLVKFVLKLKLTAPPEQPQHDANGNVYYKPSWLRYDDERAPPVIAAARRGNAYADAALREGARELISHGQPLPERLGHYIADDVLPGQTVKRRQRGRSGENYERDYAIFCAVEMVAGQGFARTRNEATTAHDSACSIVARALQSLKVPLAERRIEKIWNKVRRSIPAYNNPPKSDCPP